MSIPPTVWEPQPYSWTQPCCTNCWFLDHPDRFPVRIKDPEVETCVHCNRMTLSGIFVRINPNKAPYPTREKKD